MKDKKLFLGIILILLGLIWTLSNFNLIGDQWVLPFVGIVLFAAYLYRGGVRERGTIGFLIGGCIVFMVGLFAGIQDNFYLGSFEGSLFFFFIGLAFIPVYLFHTRHLSHKEPGYQKWPLYTSFIIIVFALFILITETANLPIMRRIFPILWPVALIAVGLYIIFKNKNKEN